MTKAGHMAVRMSRLLVKLVRRKPDQNLDAPQR